MDAMHDRNRTRFLFRSYLMKLGELVDDGSWEAQQEEEHTRDGKGVLYIGVRPADAGKASEKLAEEPAADTSGRRGRAAEVARAILRYLRAHPGSTHADILAAMDELGFSATATNDNLRVLRNLGLVTQPGRGEPYTAAE
jgi:hypothetical protein